MKRSKLIIGISAVILGLLLIILVLADERTLVTHPKGIIAQGELELITTNILLMLSIIVPTLIFLFWTVWKYGIGNSKPKIDADHTYGAKGEIILWIIPSIIVAIMAVITWNATHALDPYKPIESELKPMTIQVVALDWKWLFIYPELGIATLNYVQFPEKTPIHLKLAADGSPMNSFWLPELSGQIYAMTGMTTQLHIMADSIGIYHGRAAEINGEGYADMTFIAESTSKDDFEKWVTRVKQAKEKLNEEVYNELAKPSIISTPELYSSVKEDLYHTIVHKYMYPTTPLLWKDSSTEN